MKLVFAFILLLFGAVNFFTPQAGWYLATGWKLANAEPSDFALGVHRISGAIALLVGLGILAGFIYSAVSPGTASNSWTKQFHTKLDSEVAAVTVGIGGTPLDADTAQQLIAMLRQTPLYYTRTNRGGFGTAGRLEIRFRDGSSVELYNVIGGGWEIHAQGMKGYYTIGDRPLQLLLNEAS